MYLTRPQLHPAAAPIDCVSSTARLSNPIGLRRSPLSHHEPCDLASTSALPQILPHILRQVLDRLELGSPWLSSTALACNADVHRRGSAHRPFRSHLITCLQPHVHTSGSSRHRYQLEQVR